MTFNEAQARVRVIIDDAAATVTDYIYESVKYLNNFFYKEGFDSTVTTVAAQNYVDCPATVLDVEDVWVDGEKIEKLSDEEYFNLAEIEDEGIERWHKVANGTLVRIYFTVAPATTGLVVRLKVKSRFTLATADTAFDFPRELDELVIVGAVLRYYQFLILSVCTNREKYPDVKPNEIINARKNLEKHYNDLLSKTK